MQATKTKTKSTNFVETPAENFTEDKKIIAFTENEWAHLQDEVAKQFSEGDLDFGKAVRNARYLADIDEGFTEIESGHWTEHELIEVDENE